jgi:hypothetical protein
MKKVKDLIEELSEFNQDADIMVSTGDTFDDVSDFELTWGGPDSGDGQEKSETRHVYINFNRKNEETYQDRMLVKVHAHVRYWEDSDVNGEEDDNNNPKMPCVTGIYDGSGRLFWCPIIDVETGQIINWENGVEASIHYKVCDECGITIVKGIGTLYDDEDYVPGFLCPKEEGYGDYIIMDIDKDGFIKDWDKSKVYDFLFDEEGY